MAFRYLILAAIVACAFAVPAPQDDLPNLGIVGGKPANIKTHPYQVSIRNFRGSHYCGGSIISKRVILTAAHCVHGQTPNWLTIRAGSTYHQKDGQIVNVLQAFVNPKYNTQNFDGDIAMLVLDKDLIFNDSVKPIAISRSALPFGKVAVVSGWGATAEGQRASAMLLSVVATVFESEKCRAIYKQKFTDNMFCAGHMQSGKDSCQGDSGGPLEYNGALIGVVSWGIGCARANLPGVYTDVSRYTSWIDGVVKQFN